MREKLSTPLEPFALSPLLALLPEAGSLSRLESLLSSLYARRDKIEALRESHQDKDSERRLSIESAMLDQVLDWLAAKPEQGE